jgi:opacity protein-like surface antigen
MVPVVIATLRRGAPALALAALVAAALPLPARAVSLTRLEFLQESVKTPDQSFVTGFGMKAHLAGGDLDDGFAVVAGLENWKKIARLPELGVPELRQSDWWIGADLRYRFGDPGGWTPYAGAGLGLNVIDKHVEVGPQYGTIETREDSSKPLAPNLLIGADLPPAGHFRSSIEASYHFVPDLKQFKINFGFGYQFGPKDQPIQQ